MAGESPDRSKQRESSAEPTSGSAGPVPGKRDPRWAVSREAESSEDRGNVDTATRVLSARDDTPAGEGDGSGRLREAVATWVRSAEPAEDPDGAEDGTEDASGAGTTVNAPESGASGAQDKPGAEPESDRTDTAGEDTSERTAAAAKPEDEAEDAPETDTPKAAPEDEDAPEDATDASRGQDGPGNAGSGTPTATADTLRTEDEPGNTARATTETGTDTHTPKPTTDASRTEDEPGNAGTNADAPTTTASAGDTPRAEDEPEDTGKDAPGAGAGGSGASEDAEGEAAGGTAESTALTGADAGEENPEAGSSGGGDGKPAADPAPVARGAGDDTSAEDDDTSAEDDEDEDEPGDEPAAGTAAGDGRPKAKGPVDQPTAVFRTGRPSAPAVDQPTTMLKLGDAGREAAAEAERTSKFVALKRDDDLGARKPPAAPVAPTGPTTSLPQVGPERTTQQPLPPRPPLDLLAELTNTPPPPQTPLRTAVRRVKIWTPLALLLVIVFAVVQAVRPLPATTLTLTAEDSYTFEGGKLSLSWPSEGQGWMDVNGIGTMDSYGDQEPVAIGSVAKAMTAYVVLKDHQLKSGSEGPDVPVDATAEKEGGYDSEGESTLNTIKEGDKLTLRQAISAIMIPSANNIARLLARWDAGSEAEFIQKMNDAAKELGMENTTYTDASGLKETTVSTAEDQVKLGNELVKMPALMEITKLPEWIDPSGTKHRNYNTLVPYNNALGIKTGSTTKAGGNLLFAATKEAGGETVTVVGAILGQHKPPIIDTVNAVSKTALLAAQEAITSAKIVKKGDVVGYVDDQMGGRTPVVAAKDVPAVGWAGLTVKLSFAPSEVPHTAKAGTEVGTLTVGDGSSGAVKVPVALQEDLVEPGFTDKLTRLT